MEAVTDFLFLGSKISVDGDGSHEIKGCLLGFPGSSVVKNLPAKAGDTGSIPDPGRFTCSGTCATTTKLVL